jgi:RND family efflux transporter MFP subunit
MKRRRMRRFAVAVAVLAVLFLVLWLFTGRSAAASAEDWAKVERQDLVMGVEVTGTLDALQSAQLGPPRVPDQFDFKIAFLAPEGSEVHGGQPVLAFDTSTLERTLLEKMTERDSAQKELEKRQTDLAIQLGDQRMQVAEAEATQRRAALQAQVSPDLIGRNELESRRADLALANERIDYQKRRLALLGQQGRSEIDDLQKKRDRAAQRVAETQNTIRRMTVLAPRDGTVVYVSGRGGNKKKIGDTCWLAEKVVEIPDLRHMKADGQVDEADAGRVAAGQPVRLTLDAHPDVVFTGRVHALRGAVREKSNANPVKVMGLDLELDRTDPQRMRPGMRFLGTIEIERVAKALVIPAEAVVNRPEGPVVYRRNGWRTEEVHPRLGRRNERFVEVVSGLAPGDQVLRHAPEGGEG